MGFVESPAQQSLYQGRVADLVIEAEKRRADLGVEQWRLQRAAGIEEHLEVLARGVQHLGGSAGSEQLMERCQVGERQRIDQRQLAAGGDLHQAQARAIGALAHELGVEHQCRLAGQGPAQVGEGAVGIDQIQGHGRAV
jgi:hypothetical protein